MNKFTLLLLAFTLVSTTSISQDYIPYYQGFSYNASNCHLSISYYIKNSDDNGGSASSVSYKVIIFDVDDNYEVFNTDVHLDKLGANQSSAIKSFEIDLPALAGYDQNAIYKLAVIANPDAKSYEAFTERKNNRIETPQFSCSTKSNGPKRVKNTGGNGAGSDSSDDSNNTKSYADMQKEHKADQEAFTEMRNDQSEQAIGNATSKINLYKREIDKLKSKKSSAGENELQLIQNLDTEIKILNLKIEMQQNVIYEKQDIIANKGAILSKEQRTYYKKAESDLESQIALLEKNFKVVTTEPTPFKEEKPVINESKITVETSENILVLQKSKGSTKEMFYEGNFQENDQFRIVLANALAVPEYFKCKVTITNKTSQYMIVKLSDVKVWIGGKYSTNFKEKDLVIAPGATSSKTYDVKGVNMSQEILRFDFNNVTTYTDQAPL